MYGRFKSNKEKCLKTVSYHKWVNRPISNMPNTQRFNMKKEVKQLDHWVEFALDLKSKFTDWEDRFDAATFVYEKICAGEFKIHKPGDKLPKNRILVTDFSFFPKV